jgi:TP901 family phage tail tape measure protein
MATKIHMLKALVSTKTSGFEQGLRRAVQSTRELRQSWTEAGRAIASSAQRIGAVVTGMGVAAARTFAKFESTMVRVGGVTRTLGTRDFALLEQAAERAGETTMFSASQSAEAMEMLGLAGLQTREIIESLPGALQLASAAQIDIATSADIAAKTMRAFGFEAEDLSHINDTLVGTFTRANTDIRQLAEGLKPVGPLAKTLNVSLEETSTVLAKLADAGFQGSEGGTALRNILARLAGAVPAVTKQLNELGIVTLDSSGNMRPLFDILQDIERAGLTGGEIMQLFGQRGGPQLAALLDVGIEELRNFHDGFEDFQGMAERLEQENLNTLSGQFELLKSAIAGVFLTTGRELNPALRELIQNIKLFLEENKTEIVDQMAAAIRNLAEMGVGVIQWAREAAPTIRDVAVQLWQLLAPIVEFLKRHPELMAALAAFRASGLLGINQALFSLIPAIAKTFRELGRLAMFSGGALVVALTKAKAAMIALGFSARAAWNMAFLGLPAIIAGVAALAGHFVDTGSVIQWIVGWIDELITKAQRAIDLLMKVVLLGTGVDSAQERERGQMLDARIKELQQRLGVSTGDKSDGPGSQPPTVDRPGKSGVNAITEIGEALGEAFAGTAGETIGDSIEDQLQQAERRAVDREMPRGFRDLLDFISQDGVGRGAAERFAATLPGADQDMARQFGAVFEGIGGSAASPEQLQQLAENFVGMLQRIEAEQERASDRSDQAADSMRHFVDRLLELRDAGTVGVQWAENMATEAEQLAEQFRNGEISAHEFSKSMQDLAEQTDRATQAAERRRQAEEAQERRERMMRLIRGQGTAEDVAFLRSQQQAAAMQQFDQHLQMTFDSMFGLNQIVPQITQGFGNLQHGMQRFGQSMQQFIPSQGDVGRLVSQMNEAFSSRRGQIQMLHNNIQMLRQNLQVLSDPRRRREIVDQIKDLQRQIRQLSRAPTPALTGLTAGNQFFRDPGLQQGSERGAATVNLTFRSFGPPSPSDVRMIVDGLEKELHHRGRRI